jgi:NTP pyrophosphatase (non-canonical NTP hydrolase)
MKSLTEYQQQAMSTAIFPVDRSLDYTVLGLGSEVGEMAEAWLDNKKGYRDVAAEAGDCYWYSAAIASTLEVSLEDVVRFYDGPVIERMLVHNLILDLTATSGNLEGLVKKAIRDDDGHFSAERRDKAIQLLGKTVLLLDVISSGLGTTRWAVMNDNLDKLASRKQRGVLSGSGDHR